MNKILLILLIKLVLCPLFVFAQTPDNTRYYVALSTDSSTDILPVWALMKDNWHKKPSTNASYGFSHNELMMGAELNNNNAIEFIRRTDYTINSNADTAEAFYVDKNHVDWQQKYYDVRLTESMVNSYGVAWKKSKNFNDWQITARLQLLYVEDYRALDLDGFIDAREEDDQDIYTRLTYQEHYLTNNLLKRPNDNDWQDYGYGFSVDLAISKDLGKFGWLRIASKDLWSQLRLKDAGYSNGHLDSDNLSIVMGAVVVKPVFTGFEGKITRQHSFKPRIVLHHQYSIQEYDIISKWQHYSNHDSFLLGLGIKQYQLLVGLNDKSIALTHQREKFQITLALKRLDYKDSQVVNVGISYQF